MAQNPVRILSVGPANGQLTELFSKVAIINSKHGPFDILLCSGDLFGETNDEAVLRNLINNKIDVPITTYFITGSNPLPSLISNHIEKTHGEVCSNLFYLGKQGVLTTTQGCRIAYLSGSHFPDVIAMDTDSDPSSPSASAEGDPTLFFRTSDITTLIATPTPPSTPPGMDILLTYEWPHGVTRLSSQKVPVGPIRGTQPVAELAAGIQPRYHFACKERVFLEREPYRNVGAVTRQAAGHVTRFIGLGELGNKEKVRWFYAFNIVPLSTIQPSSLLVKPPNTTDIPFTLTSHPGQAAGVKRSLQGGSEENDNFFWGDGKDPKRRPVPDTYICRRCNVPGHWIQDCPSKGPGDGPGKRENYVCRLCGTPGHHIRECPEAGVNKPRGDGQLIAKSLPEGYVCKICNEPGHFVKECPNKEERDRAREAGGRDNSTDACWFCLANPKVAKHLIISIGTEIYLTLAKGPLITSSVTSAVPGGGHVLLIPIGHHPSLRKIAIDAQVDVVAEMERFKSALRRFYAGYGCEAVVFEVCRESMRGLTHAHLQIVPVPKEMCAGLEEAFVEEGGKQPVPMKFGKVLPEDPDTSYFKVDLPNNTSLVHVIKPQERFNLQFGRTVLANILGTPERADWKACPQSEEEEKRDSHEFKAAFREFDFTLE